MNKSPLATPAWIEFNTTRHRLTAHHVSLSTAEGDRLDAVLYLDRRGRVVMPPNNPYLPLSFETRRTTAASRTAAWVRISRPLLDELLGRGVVNRVQFPPDVADIRPFTWDGFRVNARYTYVLDLPIDPSRMSAGMRKDVRRAERAGTSVERTDDLDAVMACLSHAEQRQRFSHGLTRRDLEAAADLMGLDGLRMYVARDAHGRPASALVDLHVAGGGAIGWLSGSTPEGLNDGASLAALRFEFDDLAAAGATSVDLCGANIASVAESKARWGAELRTTFSVRDYSMRSAVRYALDWREARRRRVEAQIRRRDADPGVVAPDLRAPNAGGPGAEPKRRDRREWWRGLPVIVAGAVDLEGPLAVATSLVG